MDVDIDFDTEFDPLTVFPNAVRASQCNNGKLTKHPAGAYLQTVPVDPITGLSAIPYDRAEEYGFFKVDFLHLSAIDEFSKYISKAELRQLVKLDPNWDLLLREAVVEQLFQVHRYAKLLAQIKPRSVMMLADAIALIRPAKRPLIHTYVECDNEEDRETIRQVLYEKPEDGAYYYKKPHAVGYATTIVVQLHLIEAGLM